MARKKKMVLDLGLGNILSIARNLDRLRTNLEVNLYRRTF
jgi:hypothetical protein